MIGWSTIRPVLIAVITEIGADTTRSQQNFTAGWKDLKRGIIHPEQRLELLLKVTSVVGIGEDETRREMVDGVFVETQVGQRKFVLQVQASVPVPADPDAQLAFAATERIRTRIRRPRIIQQLLDAEIAFHKCGPALPTPYKDGDRVVDCATLDITFGTVVNDEDPIPASWIESVVVTSHIQDTDGTQLPASLQQVAKQIPDAP